MYYHTDVDYEVYGRPGGQRTAHVGIERAVEPSATEMGFMLWSYLDRLDEPVERIDAVNGVPWGMAPGDLLTWLASPYLEWEAVDPRSIYDANTDTLPVTVTDGAAGGFGGSGDEAHLDPVHSHRLAILTEVFRGHRATPANGRGLGPRLRDIVRTLPAPVGGDDPYWGRRCGIIAVCGALGVKRPWVGDLTEMLPAVFGGGITRRAHVVRIGGHMVAGPFMMADWYGIDGLDGRPDPDRADSRGQVRSLGQLAMIQHMWMTALMPYADTDDLDCRIGVTSADRHDWPDGASQSIEQYSAWRDLGTVPDDLDPERARDLWRRLSYDGHWSMTMNHRTLADPDLHKDEPEWDAQSMTVVGLMPREQTWPQDLPLIPHSKMLEVQTI